MAKAGRQAGRCQLVLLKETHTFNQTREDPISKNHNLKGNESKLKYFYSKIINLDKPEQIAFVPKEPHHLHTLMMQSPENTQFFLQTRSRNSKSSYS